MKRANEFLFLTDLMLHVLRAAKCGATVTKFVHQSSKPGGVLVAALLKGL